MPNRIIKIFQKDFKVAKRDSILSYLFIFPVLFSVFILLLIPNISDLSIKTAMLSTEPIEYINYMKSYTQVELFDSIEELERRILKQDDVAGFVSNGDTQSVVLEGNEDPITTNLAKLLNSKYKEGASRENSTAEIYSFKNSVNPIKIKLTNMLILTVIMISGMIISLGIVEEKSDNTISAMNVSPVSQGTFIAGKSLLGGFSGIFGIIASLLILGYVDINWFMIIIISFTGFILSALIGFLQGLNSKDIMEAAGGVKIIMLPIAGSIAGYEMLADKWQWTMYWSPFYWAYKANDMILSKRAIWSEIILYAALVLIISSFFYIIFIPRIKKGLSKS